MLGFFWGQASLFICILGQVGFYVAEIVYSSVNLQLWVQDNVETSGK